VVEVGEEEGAIQGVLAVEEAVAEGVQENGNFRRYKEQNLVEFIKVLTSIGKIMYQVEIEHSPDDS
jgi:hypothetical protein